MIKQPQIKTNECDWTMTMTMTMTLPGGARALVFEHFRGSRVLDGVMSVYRLPNGRDAYYYDKGSSAGRR